MTGTGTLTVLRDGEKECPSALPLLVVILRDKPWCCADDVSALGYNLGFCGEGDGDTVYLSAHFCLCPWLSCTFAAVSCASAGLWVTGERMRSGREEVESLLGALC